MPGMRVSCRVATTEPSASTATRRSLPGSRMTSSSGRRVRPDVVRGRRVTASGTHRVVGEQPHDGPRSSDVARRRTVARSGTSSGAGRLRCSITVTSLVGDRSGAPDERRPAGAPVACPDALPPPPTDARARAGRPRRLRGRRRRAGRADRVAARTRVPVGALRRLRARRDAHQFDAAQAARWWPGARRRSPGCSSWRPWSPPWRAAVGPDRRAARRHGADGRRGAGPAPRLPSVASPPLSGQLAGRRARVIPQDDPRGAPRPLGFGQRGRVPAAEPGKAP